MRKFLMAVAIGGLVLLVAAPAMALDFKFGAEYRVRFYDYANTNFDSDNQIFRGNPGGVQIRVRPRFDVSDDNGNIQATIRFEYGDTNFGQGGGANGSAFGVNGSGGATGNAFSNAGTGNRVGTGSGGSIGTDGVGLETKWAFIDFAMPANSPVRVRAGLQPIYLPKGLIVDDDAAGVRLYGKYGIVSYDASWYRLATPSRDANAGNGLIGQPRNDNTKDNNFDWWSAKVDFNIAPWMQAGIYGAYGRNAANCTAPNPGFQTAAAAAAMAQAGGNYITPTCPTQDRTRDQGWFGLTFTGKVQTVDYDLDFVYGSAKGGSTGAFSAPANAAAAGVINSSTTAGNQPMTVSGFALDGGVHIPIGPVKLNLLGSYATGDGGDGMGQNSGAFPYGPGPSWSGAGGQYELIGEGGAFDVVSTQNGPTNLWMLGTTLEYVPVKALWLKAAYGFVGFSKKSGNCANYMTYAAGALANDAGAQCYGPVWYGKPGDNLQGESTLGQEFHLRADYTMWTGFKVQGMVGWFFPSNGDVMGKYILQLLYNF